MTAKSSDGPTKSEPIAETPAPPYYAVIFSSLRTSVDDGYRDTADEMMRLAATQPGYLGVESCRDDSLGITVSYWASLEAIRDWKQVAEHRLAQRLGRERWYSAFKTRVARVERDYGFVLSAAAASVGTPHGGLRR